MSGIIPASRPLLSLGGVNTSLPNLATQLKDTKYFTLSGRRQTSATNGVSNFTRQGGATTAAAYQVTAGKTLKVVSLAYLSDTAGFEMWQFLTSTAAFDVSSGLTGAVYQFGATSRYAFPVLTANAWTEMSFQYEFAANLYPGFQATTTPAFEVWILCYEE